MDEVTADQSQSPPSTTCRVAIIGAQRQRVAKVAAILHANESLGYVAATSLLISSQSTTAEKALADTLPKGVPTTVGIEYLPCVATFDSYEDEHGATVRYLAKLEYHGPNGTLVKGKSLAPFFDDIDIAGEENPFPGIAAVAIGCGIDTKEDVDKIQSFMETLSSSCAAQLSKQSGMVVECIQPNAEYSSMKEENEAFRDLSPEEKKEAVANGTIGPGKMGNFVYTVAKGAIRERWNKELTEYEKSFSVEEQQTSLPSDETTEIQSEQQSPAIEPVTHTPNPDKTRYACRRCRTILFGVEDLEDPPHAQSQHDFRKRGKRQNLTGSCQNHFLAQPLPWMNGCDDVEGKFHCPKCDTKVGHYSWTGAQCSCGTWVTPAIMVPMSKVDEMKPISHNVIGVATGLLVVDHRGLMGSSSAQPSTTVKGISSLEMMNQGMSSVSIVEPDFF